MTLRPVQCAKRFVRMCRPMVLHKLTHGLKGVCKAKGVTCRLTMRSRVPLCVCAPSARNMRSEGKQARGIMVRTVPLIATIRK